MPIELYCTPALPNHYVAKRGQDLRLLAASKSLEPCNDYDSLPLYRGNYLLERVRPQIIERWCQPR